MDFSQNEISPLKRFSGLSVVILVHLLVAYALIMGLGRKLVDVIKEPEKVEIVKEVAPPPPPDKPPPPPPPKLAAPPPPFIPPPEVVVSTPVAPTITSMTSVAPDHAANFQKSTAPAVGKSEIPDVPVAAFADLNGCKPEYPRASLLAEEEGTVRIQFVIGINAQVVSSKVVKSSGFQNLDKAAVNALSRCKFKPAYRDGKPLESTLTSDYVWKMDE